MFAAINRNTVPVAEAERHQLWVQTDVDGVARCDNEYHLGSARTGRLSTVPFLCTPGGGVQAQHHGTDPVGPEASA
jgi:hypothetical protein